MGRYLGQYRCGLHYSVLEVKRCQRVQAYDCAQGKIDMTIHTPLDASQDRSGVKRSCYRRLRPVSRNNVERHPAKLRRSHKGDPSLSRKVKCRYTEADSELPQGSWPFLQDNLQKHGMNTEGNTVWYTDWITDIYRHHSPSSELHEAARGIIRSAHGSAEATMA